MNKECAECGSNRIMGNVKITDFGESQMKNNLSIHLQKSDRMFFNSYAKGEFLATICANCGKVDLRITNTEELWNAYIKNNL